jgi:hypothetical protein
MTFSSLTSFLIGVFVFVENQCRCRCRDDSCWQWEEEEAEKGEKVHTFAPLALPNARTIPAEEHDNDRTPRANMISDIWTQSRQR